MNKLDHHWIASKLNQNKQVFVDLLAGTMKEEYEWKPSSDQWCMLEIICHLYDEEREDFRTRVKHVLASTDTPPPSWDPLGALKSRNYMDMDFNAKLADFCTERDASVQWLESLGDVNWTNAWQHPKFGPMSAWMFLSNWLAHDYLHIRQITRLKYNRLKDLSNETLRYAGNWDVKVN